MDLQRELFEAQDFADKYSDDPGTKVGCTLLNRDGHVVMKACNRFPRGVIPRLERPEEKRAFIEHAERNGLYECCRQGVSTHGCTAVLTLFCCAECARGLIQAGVARVVSPRPDFDHERWGVSWAQAQRMLQEANVAVTFLG